jgi:hypothetical protein
MHTSPPQLLPHSLYHPYKAMARHSHQVIGTTLSQLGLQPEVIAELVIVDARVMSILFVVLDTRRVQGKLKPYEDALHQISTNLKGLPVAVSNSTGFRYAILLSPPPDLPRKVELPTLQSDLLQIGVRVNGQNIAVQWDDLGHLLVVGMTRSGKSAFLRALAYQALGADIQLMLGDRPLTTFPMLAGHKQLLKPIADTPAAYFELIRQGLAICEDRKDSFAQAQGYPEKLSEYNAWAVKTGSEILPRILIILDEYNATANTLGKSFEQAVSDLVFQGLKFGVHFVAAAQEFSKKTLGNMRDQFGTVIAFRVKNSIVARNVGVQGAARIPHNRKGLAVTDRWGLVQTYLLPKERLIATTAQQQPLSTLTQQERHMIRWALKTEDGKVSIPLLVGWAKKKGWGGEWTEWKTRQRVEAWERKGWIQKDPNRKNARFVTEKLAHKIGKFAPNTQTPQSASLSPQAPQTEAQTHHDNP